MKNLTIEEKIAFIQLHESMATYSEGASKELLINRTKAALSYMDRMADKSIQKFIDKAFEKMIESGIAEQVEPTAGQTDGLDNKYCKFYKLSRPLTEEEIEELQRP